MLAVLRVCYCLAWFLRCGECLPRRRGVDGQRPDTGAQTTGGETEAVPPGADPFPSPRGSSSDSLSFLRELQAFLGDVFPLLPAEEAGAPSVQLRSLQCLPPLALGPSSSETLLVGLFNSSSPTVFSFPSPRSAPPPLLRPGRGGGGGGGGGALALAPRLVEELRRKLWTLGREVEELLGEVEVEQRAVRSLARLKALSALPREERPAGEHQYRAFLLMLALQTVAQAYEVQRGLRATRAGPDSGRTAAGDNICGLQSLVVSLDMYLVGPNRAAINNCHGVCGFPLHNGNNHAVLLNDQIQRGAVLDRSLCCVPVTYEDLQVVELNKDGTYLSVKPNMVAKECGCR